MRKMFVDVICSSQSELWEGDVGQLRTGFLHERHVRRIICSASALATCQIAGERSISCLRLDPEDATVRLCGMADIVCWHDGCFMAQRMQVV